jgi:SdpC family antimicrobial peptide
MGVAPTSANSVSSVGTAVVAPAVSAKTDGENVFRGLFFGQGQVGHDLASLELFSEARQHLGEETPEEVRASDAVIELINKRYPGFFEEFSSASRSGDPRQVEKAVTKAQDTLLSVAEKDKDLSATPEENGQLCGVTVAVGAAVIHVAAVVTAAGAVVTVTVAVGANFVKGTNWFWSPEPDSGDGTQLSRDEAVAQVTQALQAA